MEKNGSRFFDKIEKIYIVLIVILLLIAGGVVGYVLGSEQSISNNNDINNSQLSKDDVILRYQKMYEKLIEYGKLIYENNEYLNEQSKEVLFFTSLRELSLNKGYDISLFVDPLTLEQCDLDKTGIRFLIKDVSDIDNIIYEFMPLLVCGDESSEFLHEDFNDDLSNKLYEYLMDYLPNIYDESKENVEPFNYKLTLRELQQNGYDISMFKNTDTGNMCDLDATYIEFDVFLTSDGERRYNYGMHTSCDN